MNARHPRRRGLVARLVDAIEEGVIALLLAAALVATLYRLVIAGPSAGPAGGFDPGSYLFAALVLLGMSYGVRVNAHLGVDAFVKLFGPGPRRLFGLLAVLAGLTYGALLLTGAWEQAAGQYRQGGGSGPIPRGLLLAILPAGFALLVGRLIQAGVRIWRRQQEGLLHADEAADALRRHLDSLAQAADGPARGGRKRGS